MTFKPTNDGNGRIKFNPSGNEIVVSIGDISRVATHSVTRNGSTIEHDIVGTDGKSFYASYRIGSDGPVGIDMHATEGIDFEIVNGENIVVFPR